MENNNNIDVQTPDIESREAFANHDLSGKLLEIEGIEIQTLRDYGIGLDVHKLFIQVSVIVLNRGHYYEYRHEFSTDWNSVCLARDWTVSMIETKSDPKIQIGDEFHPLRYCLESTAS